MAVVEIPARRGKAVRVRKGQTVKVINTNGQQVVDTWAFNADDPREFMSMEHSRVSIGGIHDTLIAACDRYRYEGLGCTGYHDNCTDNLASGFAELGLTPPEVPSPLNLFMNIPVIDGNAIEFRPPISTRGSYIALRAELDCVVAFSACPQDMIPINGSAMRPTEGHIEIIG